MIEKKREVFERAVGVLSKEITRIEKNRGKRLPRRKYNKMCINVRNRRPKK